MADANQVPPNHSLYNDFPHYQQQIEQLKLNDEAFARMATEYHRLDHEVRGLEKSGIPTTDQTFETLKLKRLQLKDRLYQKMQAL